MESGLKSNGSTLDTLNLDPQQAISTLIQSLKEHPVASRLQISASGPLPASELAKILIQLEEPNEGTFDYDPYRRLLEHIISKLPGHVIWESILDLIAKIKK